MLCLALLTISISLTSHPSPLTSLSLTSLSLTSSAAPEVIPKETAAHFCQLLINDNGNIYPLSHQARRLLSPEYSPQSTDSCIQTPEQLFTSYIFQEDNWQVLRLFPHLADDGTVSWYAPADDLPASLGTEHQKYIREVLPRLKAEVEACRWQTVDAYIDKMIEYQCQFGGKSRNTSPNPTLFLIIGALLLSGYLFFRIFTVELKDRIWRH